MKIIITEFQLKSILETDTNEKYSKILTLYLKPSHPSIDEVLVIPTKINKDYKNPNSGQLVNNVYVYFNEMPSENFDYERFGGMTIPVNEKLVILKKVRKFVKNTLNIKNTNKLIFDSTKFLFPNISSEYNL